MSSRKSRARLAGVLYAVMGLPAAFTLVYIPSVFFVGGGAAATTARIAAQPLLYRMGVLGEFLGGVFALWMAMVLYELFGEVNRTQARLMVAFVIGMAMTTFATTLALAAPIVLTSGAPYLSAFEKSQLDALTLAAIGIRNQGINAAMMYWGLWLLPLGALVYKSRMLPRIIGVFVLMAGVAYIIDSLTFFFFPHYGPMVFNLSTVPCGLGEVSFMLWMMIKGVKEPAA